VFGPTLKFVEVVIPEATQLIVVSPAQVPLYSATPILVAVPKVATILDTVRMAPVWVAVVVKVYQTSSLPEAFAQKVPLVRTGAESVASVVTTAVVAAQEPLGFIVIAMAPAHSLLAGCAQAAVVKQVSEQSKSWRKNFCIVC
jgi:hypothetical protein